MKYFTHPAQPGPFQVAEILVDLARFNLNKQRVFRGWVLEEERLLNANLVSNGMIIRSIIITDFSNLIELRTDLLAVNQD